MDFENYFGAMSGNWRAELKMMKGRYCERSLGLMIMNYSRNVRERIKRLLEMLPDPYRKRALLYYTRLLKTQSIVEKRVYKARILTFFCEGLKTLENVDKKEYCRRLRTLLRAI